MRPPPDPLTLGVRSWGLLSLDRVSYRAEGCVQQGRGTRMRGARPWRRCGDAMRGTRFLSSGDGASSWPRATNQQGILSPASYCHSLEAPDASRIHFQTGAELHVGASTVTATLRSALDWPDLPPQTTRSPTAPVPSRPHEKCLDCRATRCNTPAMHSCTSETPSQSVATTAVQRDTRGTVPKWVKTANAPRHNSATAVATHLGHTGGDAGWHGLCGEGGVKT